ncbi:MAG: NAD(P)H-dependent oxidoreductase [Pyrinomonadaceae bacterium]
METAEILAFAGSLRWDSVNKKMVKVAAAAAESAGAGVEYIDLRDFPLPIYDGDIESASGIPDAALELQDKMRRAKGFLIASPEYNSSLSAALKNMIDWTSRATKEHRAGASFAGKTAVLMSASPGALGGLRGLFDVRKILSTMGVVVLPEQFALGNSMNAFDADGAMPDADMRAKVEALGTRLAEYLASISPR